MVKSDWSPIVLTVSFVLRSIRPNGHLLMVINNHYKHGALCQACAEQFYMRIKKIVSIWQVRKCICPLGQGWSKPTSGWFLSWSSCLSYSPYHGLKVLNPPTFLNSSPTTLPSLTKIQSPFIQSSPSLPQGLFTCAECPPPTHPSYHPQTCEWLVLPLQVKYHLFPNHSI